MARLPFLLFFGFIFQAANAEIPGATSAPDPVNDMLAMKLATRLLNAFDQRNYTEFNDFDVRFTFDDCRHDYEAAEFLAKYAFLDAMRIVRQYDGIQFTIHVEYLGQHHDVLANFQRIRLTTGSRWRWVHAWKSNCVQDHTNVIPESSMRQKILS
ncbi:Protein CBG25247 [Caenorhabditis briggsae]|uniref:Protein CBG25247 n=1 Tax=Caenorhabditis briggsae TaxID=6238 RepID=B6IFL7_CAEBR|nr:Protein CBG25247 [Caenorhabditis briggsae]CAR98697.1 Protein CBG25247 [Caenorhabditis briggsae]